MTSADEAAKDDAAKAVMRTFADNLQPPPVADIIARAEHCPDAPHPPSAARPRGRLVLAAASVAAIAAVAIAADRGPDRGATVTTQPSASAGVPRMAPACVPALPVLDGPRTIEGILSKPIQAKAGQQLNLTALFTSPAAPDRQLLSFTVYLLPTGADLTTERAKVVARSPILRLTPGQQRVSPVVLPIPTALAPGTYDIVGYGTFPGPSICGLTNPDPSTEGMHEWGVLGSVLIN
jgi:hypothetical protein